ncbi:MAG: ATP-binding protein, partial [Dehalococcoidia bacterium]
ATHLGTTYAGTPGGLVIGRAAFAMAGLSAYTLWVFLHVFPSASTLPRSFAVKAFGTLAGVLTLAAVATPWILATQTIEGTTLKVQYGPLYPLFAIYILTCVGYSFLVIIRKIRVARGVERLQLEYLFMGLLAPGFFATLTNLVVPITLGTSELSKYGPFFSLVMITIIAHSIIRHRLMNIRLVISRGTAYLLAIAIAGGVFVTLVGLASTLIFPGHRDLPIWLQVGLALLIAVLFQPLKGWIQTNLDKYFYRQPYDYQRTIRRASSRIGTLLDLQSLLNYICQVIAQTLHPESISVYIKHAGAEGYCLTAKRRLMEPSEASEPEIIPHGSPLITILAKQETQLLRDDLRQTRSDPESQAAFEELSVQGWELVQPIVEDQTLTGFLVVGRKLSGDPYFVEDIDLSSTLVSQASIAIKNAQLYRQVILVNEYIENILGTIESGVIAVDRDGMITLFNSAAERMTRLHASNIKGNPLRRLPVPLAAPLQSTLADGASRPQFETLLHDEAGQLMPMICSTSPLKDRVETILGAVAVFSDLTRLKQLESEKRRAEQLASIGALASGIAHEIKNPLVAIRTFAELLPERFTDEDFRGDFSQVVIREIERIDDLVARLRGLATSRARSLSCLDLRETIEETLALLRGKLEQSGVTVKRVYKAELPLVAGDPAQLKQLFLNLFMNALEAMERGGVLSIHLARQAGPEKHTLVAQVSDTGTGIPENLLGSMFEPFVTTKPRGSGLGLSICQGIADAHHATIRVYNNTGTDGTTVAIEFPLEEELAIAPTLHRRKT